MSRLGFPVVWLPPRHLFHRPAAAAQNSDRCASQWWAHFQVVLLDLDDMDIGEVGELFSGLVCGSRPLFFGFGKQLLNC